MIRKIKIVTILSFAILNSYSQVKIEGKITDEKGEPYPGVSITLTSFPDSTVILYTFSDINGEYSLNYMGDKEKLLLTIKSMAILSQSKEIDRISQKVDFKIKENSFLLNEVVIKSKKIWGQKDTVNYLISAFSTKSDVVIGDVLRKMPGISVTESGAIYYQGKPINKFYVENLDLLGGRYGIATNNISIKDVSTVQVLENHQPIKALEDIDISSNAAINIKLKNDSKGALSLMAQLGIGFSPLLWKNEITGTYFEKNKQNISSFKSNNIGENLSKELQSFTSTDYFDNNNVLEIVIPSPPSIQQSRYLYNNSNAITINNLFKTETDKQTSINISYFNDYEKRNSYAHTSYYMGNDSILIIPEDMHSSKNVNKLEGELKYNLNEKNNYIDNYLNIKGQWTTEKGFISQDNIDQKIKHPIFSLSNMFHWIKKQNEQKGIELKSSLGFKKAPQTLSISPGLYEEIFNDGKEYEVLRQEVSFQDFYFRNNVNLLSPIMIGQVGISVNLGLNVNNKSLSSNIATEYSKEELSLLSDSLKNKLNRTDIDINPALTIRYNSQKMKVMFSFLYNCNFIYFNNEITNDTENISKFFFQPSLNVYYDLSNDISLNGSYIFYNQLGDINSLYTGYILENYRTLNHYDNHLLQVKGNNGGIKVNYKNIFQMLFINIGVNYSYIKKNILYDQQFDGILAKTSAVKIDNESTNIYTNLKISKGFDFFNTLINIEGGYGITKASLLRQNRLLQYKNDGINIKSSLNTKPFSWLVIENQSIWNTNWYKIKDDSFFSSIRTFRNIASGSFFLQNLILKTDYEYYYNNAASNNRSLSFLDLSLSWNWEKINFSLELNNIFNKNEFTSSYYNNITAYQEVYKIRSRNILLKLKMKIK